MGCAATRGAKGSDPHRPPTSGGPHGHSQPLTRDKEDCTLPPNGKPEDLEYLEWRKRAIAYAPKGPPLGELSDDQLRSLEAEKAELQDNVAKYLGSPEVLNAVLSPEIIGALMTPEADWSPFIRGCLKRVQDVNALGGPRMQIVWWGSVKSLQRLPMWPVDRNHVLDAERLLEQWAEEMDEKGKVNGRGFCISTFSHRWERPGFDSSAHPDTPDHKKAAKLVQYGEFGTCPIFEPHHKFDYYYWLDFAGIDQYDIRNKQLGVSKLPAFISATTEVIMYNSSTVDYEPRAWTRAERALGFTFTASPLFVYMDDNYPNEHLSIDSIVSSNPRCFAKDPESGALTLIMRDPCGDGACVTDPRDKQLLVELTSVVQKAVPLNPQRIAHGMQELDFGHARILLDTEHYSIDCEASMTRMCSQRTSITRTFSDGDGDCHGLDEEAAPGLEEAVSESPPTHKMPFDRIKMSL